MAKKVDRVRLTISIDEDALNVFREMAETTGQSVGRVIGDWCGDTAEGARFVITKMREAKRRPGLVMREMHAMAKGLQEEIYQAQLDVSKARRRRPAEGSDER